MAERGLDFEEARATPGTALRPRVSASGLYAGRPGLHRPRERPGAVGQGDQDIVNNESAEIIRMLNRAFATVGARGRNYYPERAARRRSTRSTRWSTSTSTTASTRPASPRARTPTRRRSTALFADAGRLERAPCRPALPGRRPAHRGRHPSVHDARALRSGLVGHFKCNLRRLVDYPTCGLYRATSISCRGSPRP